MDTFATPDFWGLDSAYKVDILGTMKTGQKSVKVYPRTHGVLSRLSNQYGISMSAIVDALAIKASHDPEFTLEIPPKDKRYRTANSRRALRAQEATT